MACIIHLDGTVRIWRLDEKGKQNAIKLPPRGEPITTAAFNPDGAGIITGDIEGNAQFWRIEADSVSFVKELPIFSKSSMPTINEIGFSPDHGRVFFTSTSGARILLADGQGDPITVPGDLITAFDFSPDSAWIIIGSLHGYARLLSIDYPSEQYTFRGGCGTVKNVAISPDGSKAAIHCNDSTIRIWNIARQQGMIIQRSVMNIAVSSRGGHVFTTSVPGHDSRNRVDRLWRLDPQGRLLPIRDLGGAEATLLDFSPDGKQVLVAYERNNDHLAQIESIDGKEKPVPLDNQAPIKYAVFSSENGLVATASAGGTIHIWRVGKTAERPRILHGNPSDGKGNHNIKISFSTDGKLILTSVDDHTVRIWRIDREENIDLPSDYPVVSAEFDASGKHVIVVQDDAGILSARVWHSDRAEVFKDLGNVDGASFSRDGKHILGFSKSRGISVWDMDRLDSPRILPSSITDIDHAFFGPNSNTVASVSKDGARLWHLEHIGDPLVLREEAGIWSFLISPDENFGLMVAWDDTVRSWPLSEEALMRQLQQVSTLCLNTRQRKQYLNETEKEAQSRCKACEATYNRTEENCMVE